MGLLTDLLGDGNATSEPFASTMIRRTGYYIGSPASGLSSSSFSVDFLRSSPMWLPSETEFDRIVFNVTTGGAAGAVARVGVYSSDSAAAPSDLLFDAGTIATETTGEKAITIAQTIPRGLYWLTLVTQAASSTLTTFTGSVAGRPPQSSFGIPAGNAIRSSASSFSGALPSTYPAIADQANPPLIQLRVA